MFSKHPSPRALTRPLALVGVAALLAACGASSGASASAEEPTASPPASESMAPESESMAPASSEPAETGEAAVEVADADMGQILTDPDGNTIYFFAKDTEGTSNCEGDCLSNWPPVEASDSPTAGEGVDAELGTISRSDGTTQLTVNEFPAYYFAGDSAAGDTNGQGVGGIWWVFGTDGEPIEE